MKWRYYYYRQIKLVLLFLLLALGGKEARAEDELLGSLRLRGGYDSNPVFSPVPQGTPLGGIDGAIVAGRSTDRFVAALSAEGSYTRFDKTTGAPVQRYKAGFDIANKDQGRYSLKSTSSVTSFANYDTRSLDAIERVRLQRTSGTVRPFVTAEARYFELNESNILLGKFLPQPEVFLRGTIIPGVSVKKGGLEAGASVNLSATRYRDELDPFGFRRDNERVEPFVFVRYRKDGFSLFGSLSRLYGGWHDADFSDVRKNLYELGLTYEAGPYGLEFSAKRTAEETTFPVSPVTIDTLYAGKIKKKLDANNTVTFFGRWLEKKYLDSPFVQRTTSYGAKFAHDVSDKLSFGLELYRSVQRPILGDDIDGIVAVASMTQRFGKGGDKKRAEGYASAR